MHRANRKRTARVDKFFVNTQAIKFLIKKVVYINLNWGVEKSLTAKLDSALKSLEDERPRPAINKLNAFVNQVNALSGKNIPVEEAQSLAGEARELADSLRSLRVRRSRK